jgi:hypothetical protein
MMQSSPGKTNVYEGPPAPPAPPTPPSPTPRSFVPNPTESDEDDFAEPLANLFGSENFEDPPLALPINYIDPAEDPLRQAEYLAPNLDKVENTCNLYYPQIVAHHAPRSLTNNCSSPGCLGGVHGLYQCDKCFTSQMYCATCTVQTHKDHPLHPIKKWQVAQGCFEAVRLCELGLVVKLVHEDGSSCNGGAVERSLTVFDVSGLHEVAYQQCYCRPFEANLAARRTQLVSNKLFPASEIAPRTAFTFDVLRLFDIMNLEGSINIKQFCDSCNSLTPQKYRLNEEVSTAQYNSVELPAHLNSGLRALKRSFS